MLRVNESGNTKRVKKDKNSDFYLNVLSSNMSLTGFALNEHHSTFALSIVLSVMVKVKTNHINNLSINFD